MDDKRMESLNNFYWGEVDIEEDADEWAEFYILGTKARDPGPGADKHSVEYTLKPAATKDDHPEDVQVVTLNDVSKCDRGRTTDPFADQTTCRIKIKDGQITAVCYDNQRALQHNSGY